MSDEEFETWNPEDYKSNRPSEEEIKESIRIWDKAIENFKPIPEDFILYMQGYFDKNLEVRNFGIFTGNATTQLDRKVAELYQGLDEKNYLYIIYPDGEIKGLYMPVSGPSGLDENRILLHSNQEWMILHRDDEHKIVLIKLLTPEGVKENKKLIETINNLVDESEPLKDNIKFFYGGFFDRTLKKDEYGEFKAPIQAFPSSELGEKYKNQFPSNYFYTILSPKGTKTAPISTDEDGLVFLLPSHQKWKLTKRDDENKEVEILLQ